MMKEYAKANKASDMAVETNKKKEDFGACVLFQIVCVSVLSPACPAARWAAPPPADGTQRAVCHDYVCACLFLCRAAVSSSHPRCDRQSRVLPAGRPDSRCGDPAKPGPGPEGWEKGRSNRESARGKSVDWMAIFTRACTYS